MQLKQAYLNKVMAGILLALPVNAMADATYDTLRNQVEALQKQLQDVQQSLDNYQHKSTSKRKFSALEKKVAQAAEWKTPNTLIHMSGYADVGYTDSKNTNGSFNLGSFSPIFHFQYRDLVMLESELEFEVEPDGGTSVALEYLTVDLFLNDYVALVAGKFLSPIGQFRQNLHPSWVNKLPSAVPGFGHDGAAPVSDVGLQLRGGFPINRMRTNYAIYIANGPELNAEWDGTGFELDGTNAEGFGSDRDGKKVIGGRFAVLPIPKLEFGISAATGKATVSKIEDDLGTAPAIVIGAEQRRDYDVLGFDMSWQYRGLNIRGEYVQTKIGSDNSTGVTASPGGKWTAWYAQIAYQFLPGKYEAVIRYADFNTPHPSVDQKQTTIGLNYLFANNVIGKLAYEINKGLSGSTTDENRILFQLAYGF